LINNLNKFQSLKSSDFPPPLFSTAGCSVFYENKYYEDLELD